MWPFSSDGCGHHHWGDDWRKEQKYRITLESTHWHLQEKQYQYCQHEDCRETQSRWKTVGRLGVNEAQMEKYESSIDAFFEQYNRGDD